MKKIYKSIFEKINKIVNEVDPYDLIALGAPNDEYSYEISLIMAQLKKAPSKEELTIKIEKIFQKSFTKPPTKNKCIEMGEKIFSLKHRFLLNN